MQAIEVGSHVSLTFTTVLNLLQRGIEEDDYEPTDRNYWTRESAIESLEIMDNVFELAKSLDETLDLKYNKYYVGVTQRGKAANFIEFRPKKRWCELAIKLPFTNELQEELVNSGLDMLGYDNQWSVYRIRLKAIDLATHNERLESLISDAYNKRFGS